MDRCQPIALGVAFGVLNAAYVFLAGIFAMYGASVAGLFIAAVWAFLDGFFTGCFIAWIYNRVAKPQPSRTHLPAG